MHNDDDCSGTTSERETHFSGICKVAKVAKRGYGNAKTAVPILALAAVETTESATVQPSLVCVALLSKD